MPLIQDLKNPAMRGRHWLQLKDEVQKMFDETSQCKLGLHVVGLCIGVAVSDVVIYSSTEVGNNGNSCL